MASRRGGDGFSIDSASLQCALEFLKMGRSFRNNDCDGLEALEGLKAPPFTPRMPTSSKPLDDAAVTKSACPLLLGRMTRGRGNTEPARCGSKTPQFGAHTENAITPSSTCEESLAPMDNADSTPRSGPLLLGRCGRRGSHGKVGTTPAKDEEESVDVYLCMSPLSSDSKRTAAHAEKHSAVENQTQSEAETESTHVEEDAEQSDVIEAVPSHSIEFGFHLGHGCFGHVYQATIDGETVAIKKLSSLLEPFQEEIAALSKCHHPHLAPLRFCEDPFTLIMEVHSVCLFQRLHSAPSMSLNTCQVLFEVASALSHLHGLGLCHGALKSENVLLDAEDTVKLCDFGMAPFIGASSRLQAHKQRARTICYRAPELLSSRPNFSFKSDVFSFGVLSWEVSSRKIPYLRWPVSEVESHVEGGRREDIDNVIAGKMRPLIQRAWAQKPSERPNMEDLVDELTTLRLEGAREDWTTCHADSFGDVSNAVSQVHSDGASSKHWPRMSTLTEHKSRRLNTINKMTRGIVSAAKA